MKIYYELVEKTGATHYFSGDFYKIDGTKLLVFDGCEWVLSRISIGTAVLAVKPIPKPRTRTEYEKVTESIFDLRDEFERGELYHKFEHAREYSKVKNTESLSQALNCGCCYRKVQKPVDWREEVSYFLNRKLSCHPADAPWFDCENKFAMDGKLSECDFHELCRVTLRALGEIE